MILRSLVSVALTASMVAACSSGAEGTDPDSESASESIVGPATPGGRNQAVMLYARVLLPNGTLGTRTCSGAYFGPRVVATAAHCLENVSGKQLFVYFGDNFEADFAQLVEGSDGLQPPAPGQPSLWAQADSFESHPGYDPSQHYPDLGVVYLDRKLPFEPLRLARNRLTTNREVSISGWGASSAPTPTTGAGGRVQRTGISHTLGSPTAADNHAEDPNPGLLVAANRANLLKLDGRTPNANACFGDSGGPVMITDNGQATLVGINYFTGLSCADYSLAARVSSFLPFLDQAVVKGGQQPLKATFDCVAQNASGSLTAFFGYNNKNGVSLAVPYGSKNSLANDINQRPTRFLPGEHHFSFGVDFTVNQTITWTLAPESGANTKLKVDQRSRRCGAVEAKQTECSLACRASQRSGCVGLPTFEGCVDSCLQQIASFESLPACVQRNQAFNVCSAGVSPAAGNWQCFDGFGAFAFGPCAAEADALNNCFFE